VKTLAPGSVRTVALVGHGGAGKTTLGEALLLLTGAISRLGRVDDGSAALDFEPEEAKRHQSLSLAVAALEHEEHKLNLVDTPGYPDFVHDVAVGLSVADAAVFVVSATDGVQPGTVRAWRLAARRRLPRLIFVNKLDREHADFQSTLDQLQEAFGSGVAPLELPIGTEASFTGVVDLLTDTAVVYERAGASPVGREAAIPEDLGELEHRVREALVEGIVVAEDTLMERYLEGDVPDAKELEAALATGVADATVFPVLLGSAAALVGVDRLARYLCELVPPPSQRAPVEVVAGGQAQPVRFDPTGPPLARVVRTVSDAHVGKVSLLQVVSGTLHPDIVLVNSRTHAEERLHTLLAPRGKDQDVVQAAEAGDLVAVARLGDVRTGDTLASKGLPVSIPPLAPPEPVYTIAVRPRSKGDEDKLMTALHRLQEEDSCLAVARNDETRQTLLSGMGDTHLQVVLERLRRKFGVEVEAEDLVVPYRETVTGVAEAEGKYKKQTGGHGQYGVATLRVAPIGRGEGFRFVDQVVGGAIPRQFIPAVEKGVVEAMAQGGTSGYPVVDVEVTCLDGKYHPVDSSELSFKMAGALAFREALAKAGPVVLEPVSEVEVTVPASLQGDVLGDLNARRGRVLRTEVDDDGDQVIVAHVPAAELVRYAVDLRSLTGARATFTARHDHYEVLPSHLAGRLPARSTG